MTDEPPPQPSPEKALADSADLRRHPRHLCLDAGVLRLAVRPEFRGRRGVLVNVSTSGMAFLLQDPLETGAMLAFEVQGPEEGGSCLARVAYVRHCRPHPVPTDAPWLPPAAPVRAFFRRLFRRPAPAPPDPAWLIGCEFDRPLTDDEVKQVLTQLESQNADH
jgi:hypothetical protein